MQCPNCGNTDLSPNFKFCPECGSQLASASSVAKKEEEAIAQTTSQQGLTGNDNDLTVDDRQIHGEEQQLQPQQQQQQEASTIVKEHRELSKTESIEPTVTPNTVEHGQLFNPPRAVLLENDHQTANLQATPMTQSVDSKEAGVESTITYQTNLYVGTRCPPTDPTSPGEEEKEHITPCTVTYVNHVQIWRGAAKLAKCNPKGTSDVAVDEEIILGEPKEPPCHWDKTSGDPQQQKLQEHLQSQLQPSQQEGIPRLPQKPQQKRHPPSPPSLLHQQQQQQQQEEERPQQQLLPLHPQQEQRQEQQQQQLQPLPLQQQPYHQQQLLAPQQHERPLSQELHQQVLPRPSQQEQQQILPPRQYNYQQHPPSNWQCFQPPNDKQETCHRLQALPPQGQQQQPPPPNHQHQRLSRSGVRQGGTEAEGGRESHAQTGEWRPLSSTAQRQDNVHNSQQAAETSNGCWYQKKVTQPQDTAEGKRNNEDWKKEERNREGHLYSVTSQPPISLEQVEPESGVTVVFHVLLVTNFNMEEERLHIRAHGEDFGDFKINCVDLNLVGSSREKEKKKLMHYSGQFTLSVDRARRGTDYKYAILKKGNVYWEYLAEFRPRVNTAIVNRFLHIPEKYHKPGAKWDQIDGVAYIYGKERWWEKLWYYVHGHETEENRTIAFSTYFPKWKGFLVDEPGEEMTATEALVKLDEVITCLTKVSVKESYSKQEIKEPPGFNIKKVLVDLLIPKVRENAAVLSQSNTDLNTRASALVSSLAIVLLLEKYNISLKREIQLMLLKCLALQVDPTAQRCTPYEVVLEEFSDGLRARAAEVIENLCNITMADHWKADGEWLFAVPLLHFLREDSKPFEEPHMMGSYNQPEWIGAQKLRIKEFQRSGKQNLLNILPQLTSAFELDCLLKRTFLHAMPVWELHKIVSSKIFYTSDICVALVTFLCDHLYRAEWIDVGECIKLMIPLLVEEQEIAKTSMVKIKFTTAMCLKLLETCLKKLTFSDHLEIICLSIKLLFTSILKGRQEMLGKLVGEDRQAMEGDPMNRLLEILQTSLTSKLPPKMSDYYQSDEFLEELEIWSKLFWLADANQGFDDYREFLAKELMNRARRMEGKYLVEIFCEVPMEAFEKSVGETFTALAFEAVESIIHSPQKIDADIAFRALKSSSDREEPKKARKYGAVLSVLLTKSWPKVDGGTDSRGLEPRSVEFLLTWGPITGYLKFFGDESRRGEILTPEGQETLSMAKSLLEALVRVIWDASVTVEILLLLQKHRLRFLELLKTYSPLFNEGESSKMPTKEETEQSLTERIEEVEEFQAAKEEVLSFSRMCDLIQPANITHAKTKASQDVSLFQICDLCERKADLQIEVKFFELPSVIKDVLSPLHKVQVSLTFQELWVQYGKKAQTARKNDETQKQYLSLSNVVDSVWKPAYKEWIRFVAGVMDGSLTLGDVDKFFNSYQNRKPDLMRELVCILNLGQSETSSDTRQPKEIAEQRAAQILQYQQLHQYAKAAGTICEFKEAMGFSGDFKVIEDMRNQLSIEFKRKSLDSIGRRFAEAGRALECLDEDKARCFRAVVVSRRLVEWLRTSISSTQELKVLVDLALISAGESDMETDRISNLHTSCLGFAPLIFDLKESPEHKVDFDQLMKACDPVWKAVEGDQRLPQKLFDTSRHLEWLKTLQESHGSVAMTSLKQAKMINSSGVYTVGKLAPEENFLTECERQLSLNNVVTLTVPPKDKGEDLQSKTYSLDDLKVLQSKLMLIAGKAEKGKDEVERFAKNLEGVLRLATAYVNLSESGFVHRIRWRQEFHCCKDQREGESIAEELAAASTVMEDCHFNWKRKVSNARNEYQELNFFTTQQLILLRKEIATACCSSDLQVSNLQVLALLESVHPSLDTETLRSAIQRAFRDTDLLDQTKRKGYLSSISPHQAKFGPPKSLYQKNNYVDKSPSTMGSTSLVRAASVKKPKPKDISKIRKFLNAAEDKEYSEQVALSALACLGVDAEEDDLLMWCLEDAHDADLESLYEEAMNNRVIAREINPEIALDDQEMQLEENSVTIGESDRLLELPSQLPQSLHEGNRDEDNEAEIGEYLTLAQLGSILRELAVKDKRSRPRTFPAFLRRGRPNLMLVPKGDVLATILALYMHDKHQPLPSHEEVLICTPETTAEEVELFWRRAIGDLERQFYCLVHADQLDFSISKKAVDMLSELTQGLAGTTGENYGLVVICSIEKEERANIVAALDQYRVAAPPCPSSGDLQSYLKRQFRIPPPQYGYISGNKITWTAAGSLDPEKLCVRVVSSSRGGLGKTLFVRRLTDQLSNLVNNDMVLARCSSTSFHVTVPLHGNSTDSSVLVDSLLPYAVGVNVPLSRVFHLDVSPSVRRGLDTLLFNLLVLGSICDKMGRVWRRRSTDLYVIEVTTAAPLPTRFSREEDAESQEFKHSGRSSITKRSFYKLLPTILCATPRTVSCLLAAKPDPKEINPMFDVKEFRSVQFQRVYQYLKLTKEGANIENFTFVPGNIDDDRKTCLTLLLSNCGIPDPSWSEIRHFVSFLNTQLRDCEQSIFCDMKLMRSLLAGPNVPNLEGFRSFVVRFMIQMSRDFATPSLTEENTVFFTEDHADLESREIEQFKLRRSWESSPHPYLFFNEDRMTMTFLGFSINSAGDLVDPQTNRTLERGLISKQLRIGLQAQRVDFIANAENWNKVQKINQLCSVMGVKWMLAKPNHDPDRAYELTTDNVKKILAIHMRFRCNIPVIVMGETGCGKTRLIRYMCGLQAGPRGPRNMLLVKVHGGTTYEDIEIKVGQAEEMARENQDKNIDTVLFFDEANTTEALSMIKEVMVDRKIRGRPIGQGVQRLQFIAACNPYRRHTDDMIHKLESAGLGYHLKTDESDDRLGHIPLRHLVYRVHALPGSMRPLIWDFGQLNHETEGLYTNQIVIRYILQERQIPGDLKAVQAVAAVLTASQKYMRDQLDECSFVSLRDVERAMQVMVWFYSHLDTLGRLMKTVIKEQRREEGDEVDECEDVDEEEPIDPITRALVLAIGVCYHAKLQDRRGDYRTVVAQSFKAPCLLPGGQKQILREITRCQRAVLNELELGPNIARNTALSENVFMMVVCIELRIPLFVVGKPGSSKSLAKTVVADNMQGDAARSELFKTLKQVHMVSYQCSPLSTPEGIVATFRQCSKLQEGKNPDRFVSVVVLDEVGLAEDSPFMPLKTLHPLLEDGVTSADDVIETDEKPQRVAFIGISNWALDPAKMNRGIMLSRGVPDVRELIDSALGICSTDKRVKHLIQAVISPLADGYAELYKEQKNFATLKKCSKDEFFGLRDFYSLIKMVYAMAAKFGQRPRWNQLEHAIRRNFGGLVEGEPVEIFKRYFQHTDEGEEPETSTTIRLIEASLGREDVADQDNFSENRYLLILTENYAALRIVQQHLLKASDDAVVIFGSGFPNDQEYTQVCRNINRIKVCMETGRTVILLNLEGLYESLYDALNQYYVYFGGQKYVDLGLGTHRVKCRVHDDFKLIVIAEKDAVYNSFPIPLINRLEKHFLVTSTSLTADQMKLVENLRFWAHAFAEVTGPRKRNRNFSIGDAFVGYHEDTIPAIVMQVCNDLEEEGDTSPDVSEDPLDCKVLRESTNLLLEMAAPDAIARLPASGLKGQAREIWNSYFHGQQHSSLAAFMSHALTLDDCNLDQKRKEGLFIQITTHSRLLSNNDVTELCYLIGFRRSTVDFVTLQQFQTEQQFRTSARNFFLHLGGECPGILIVQCDSGDDNSNLIAGARHILMEERKEAPELLNIHAIEAVHIVLVVQLPRIAGGCRNFVGFQGGKWMSTHIDELRPPGQHTPSIEHLIDRPISDLFRSGKQPDNNNSAQILAVSLLRNCVQAAACRVDDEAGSPERSTQRIELLLELLREDSDVLEDERTFSSVLTQRTYYLLKEGESNAVNAHEWLHSEALSGTGVQEWGTFRKALWKRVYAAVVPILAEIIAFADRDSNLDLIKWDNSWVSTLWLKILANRNISELSYSTMISPVTNSVRERVQVVGSGAGGHSFQCLFPFSCLVKQRMVKLLKAATSVAALSRETVVESLRALIENSELGPLLDELRHEHVSILAYLSDFVHMVYKPSSASEHELVCEAILSSAKELGVKEDEDENELLDFALIHVAHSRIQSRLSCFVKLVQAQPNIVTILKEIVAAKESEVLLDVLALHVCLEELKPSEEVLLNSVCCQTWCDRVLSIRPVVEDMMRKEEFKPNTEESSSYGEKASTLLGNCRSMWQRAGAVRLFVEHVTLFDEEAGGRTSESVVRLWKALGDETDFSSLTSLQTTETFLITYSKDVKRSKDERIVSELRRRCNAFFVELVSLFCFGESSKHLKEEALAHLMRYVIGGQSTQTKNFSPFPDYGVDATPVVRSFLLQQLLRSSTKFVVKHLEDFLQGAQSLKPEPRHIAEVCFLCVQCMEDALIRRYQAKVLDSKMKLKLKHAKRICDEAFKAVVDDRSSQISANSLEGVAKGRYVLTLVAQCLYKCLIEKDLNYSEDHEAQREMKFLLESVRQLCIDGSSTTPQLYLVKQLVRRYGFDCVRTPELKWILPPEARQEEEDVILDRFVVHGNQYRAVREALAKAVISGNIHDIANVISDIGVKGNYKDVLLLLALYREITLANASSQQQKVSEEVKEKLEDFIKNGGHFSLSVRPLATQFLENSQGGQFRKLQVFPGKSTLDHTLAEIVIHTTVALESIGSRSLAEPLHALMTDPSTMKNSFFPTMPEDNFQECIAAIAKTFKGTNWAGQWYECGHCKHPYFIGECSQPMEKSQCPDCGKVLGGEHHKFLGEYKISNRQDRTKTGHALGEPGSRPTIAEPQRNLSPILCGLLRILLHSAMVMGACINAQVTAQLITPPCEPEHVAEFLWQHMQRDLDVLGRALGRSVDDAVLTVHLVLQRTISLNGGQTANSHDMRLQTRDSRRAWETDFSSVFLVPVIRKLDQNLQKASRLLMKDERFGSDPLVRLLYEFDEQIEDLSRGVRPMTRSLWKYRRQITVEHLGNSFQQEYLSSGGDQCKVLDNFLKQEHKLRSVQFLPDVVRLQRLLMDRFHRQIDRTEAERFTIREFLGNLPRGSIKEEFKNLIHSFKFAWNSCRSFLGDQGRLRVPQDLCNITMDNDCPIAMLLPSTTGMGVCSTSLTYFLVNTHDEFLGVYRGATNQESPLERVSVSDVTMSHLIAYDPERDLLPLILAHCNYSLEVGQETLVQYDWAALERQLIDRFLRGRLFVDFKEERFAFRGDTRDDTVFASLKEKIPQELISRVIEGQIIAEFRSSLSDVCDVLSSLDIAIGFLASSGGQKERPLKGYLHEVLKLSKERGLKSPTAEQHCNLSHILALWRLLALEKAKIKSRNKQEPFEEMSDIFKEKLSSSNVAHLNRVLRKIDMDVFLPHLVELILLNVKHAKENIASMSFGEYLELYLEEKGLEQIPGTDHISDDVNMTHLKAVWNCAVQLSDDFYKGIQSSTP